MLQISRYTAKYQGRFLKFCVVGLTGAGIQIGLTRLLFYMFTEIWSFEGGTANTLSVILVIPITTIWNFFWNLVWTFKGKNE